MPLPNEIAEAISRHYGGEVDVYEALGSLSAVAADLISQVPIKHHKELLDAWDESPAWVRSAVSGKRQ